MLREMSPPLLDVPTPRPVIVALCGYQKHGKTTAARYLERHLGYHRSSFADPIRAMLIAQGCPVQAFTSSHKNTSRLDLCGMTPREAMESLGDWGRDRSPDFWIRAWDRTLPQAGLVVVDDARYDLEAAAALGVARRRDAAFVMIEVFRPDHPCGTSHGSNRVPVAPAGVVADHVINDGTVDVLGARIAAVLRERGVSP